MKASAIVVAAGAGKRFGRPKPKQFFDILGKPLLVHTLAVFEAVREIDEVILLTPPDWIEHCRSEIVNRYRLKKVGKVLAGGAERQDSVFRGVQQADPEAEILVIHDGVRPLISGDLVRASIAAAAEHGAAVVAIPVADTLKRVDADGRVQDTVSRQNLWQAQTPQSFRRDIILKAYEAAQRDEFVGTDDVSLAERAGFSVRVVPGSPVNIKVTTPEDLRLAELFLRETSGT